MTSVLIAVHNLYYTLARFLYRLGLPKPKVRWITTRADGDFFMAVKNDRRAPLVKGGKVAPESKAAVDALCDMNMLWYARETHPEEVQKFLWHMVKVRSAEPLDTPASV